jgi:hypothetical protein
MNLNHEIGESVQLPDGIGRGVPVPPAADAIAELSKALLKIYSVVTGLGVIKLPDEIVERWAAEEATGTYTFGIPTRGSREALALIVGAGRFLVNAQDDLDRTVVAELLQEALKLLPQEIPGND